jgi:hypothetical protein
MRPAPVHLPGSPVRRGLTRAGAARRRRPDRRRCGGSGNGRSSSASPDTTAVPSEPSPSVATTTGGGSAGATEPTIENFAFHPDQIGARGGSEGDLDQ